jgi:transposase
MVEKVADRFRLANDDSGQAELVHRLNSYQVEGIVLEATGGIERAVMSALETAGYQTRRVKSSPRPRSSQ